jgi:hypothetical protein
MANATGAPATVVLAGINRKIRAIVVPGYILPGCYAMAGLAAGWKSQCLVVGIGGCIIIGLMTSTAAARCTVVLGGMTGYTAHAGMRTGQRIAGHSVIIG